MKFETICDAIIKRTQELIESEEFLNQFKFPKCFVRKRLLSMYHVIMYLISTTKAAMSINSGNIRDALPEIQFPKVSKQAISKARQGIKPELFQYLLNISVEEYYSATKTRKNWHGYHIFAVDGSYIHVSETQSTAEDFGYQGDSRYDRKHFMGLGSVLYDVLEDMVVDAVLGHNNSSERAFALKHIKKLDQYHLKEKSIIIFDRGYYSKELFSTLANNGYGCLMRVKANIKSLTNHPNEDDSIVMDYLDEPVRSIKVVLDTGETEYLLTNIMDKTITPELFKILYYKRWKIESKYKELKDLFRLEEFNGATSCSVMQEYFLTLFKSNVCAVIKNASDEKIQENTPKNSKHKYQADRAHIIGRILFLLPRYLCRQKVRTTLVELYEEGVRNKSLIREGRKFKRKKPTNYPLHRSNRKTTT